MLTISLDPIIFTIGHFAFRWYSVILVTAITVGFWLAGREAARKGFSRDAILDAGVWIVAGGLVGARLFHVLDHWSHEYAANPVRALYIWEGGLAIWGALAGGLLVMAFVCWRKGWRLPALLDASAPAVVLAQAIGRIACVITGDAMGKPTDGPFGFAYTSPNALVPERGVYYTPMPVYEILVNLAIFGVLWQLRKKRLPDGVLFLIYLILYSIERLLLGFTSSYRLIAWGLTQSQIIAIIGLALAIPLLILARRARPTPA
ncbi:MAG TPA: prolipoprotein diacylglyceryl transferase [Anaerolineales bacterium]